jgi:hypothetical protein
MPYPRRHRLSFRTWSRSSLLGKQRVPNNDERRGGLIHAIERKRWERIYTGKKVRCTGMRTGTQCIVNHLLKLCSVWRAGLPVDAESCSFREVEELLPCGNGLETLHETATDYQHIKLELASPSR